jgi:hypothetical protein
MNNPARMLYHFAKRRAEAKGLDFTIDTADIVIPAICPLLNIPIIPGGDRDNLPTLDRIDPSKGYIPSNILVVSWRANCIKSHATPEELLKVAINLSNICTL